MKTDMKTGLNDDMRSGIFFECKRVLEEVKPRYFLMENVIMKIEDQQIISDTLGVNPIRINSSLVSAQLRDRLYWTNIPNVTVPEDKHIVLSDILTDGYTEKQKSRCLMRNDSHGYYNGCNWNAPARYHREHNKAFSTIIYPSKENYEECVRKGEELLNGRFPRAEFFNRYDGHEFDKMRYLWKEERARLQTVPEQYVECLTEKEAADLLGDGWTVDVIAHIFSGLKEG
jgi:site-specific DNA-cytosine methylase